LSNCFRQAGWAVDEPIEAYIDNVYNAKHDVLQPEVRNKLKVDSCKSNLYWHWGTPCTWLSMFTNNFNGGSRTRDRPWGDGKQHKETVANAHARLTAECCENLCMHNSYFSIENPSNSFLWSLPPIKRLTRKAGVFKVRLHQCMYNLVFPNDKPNYRCRKDTTILTNLPGLANLGVLCNGGHNHTHAQGSISVHGKHVSRTKLAGCYPWPLCRKWVSHASSIFTSDLQNIRDANNRVSRALRPAGSRK
jgi:hypothetical protein